MLDGAAQTARVDVPAALGRSWCATSSRRRSPAACSRWRRRWATSGTSPSTPRRGRASRPVKRRRAPSRVWTKTATRRTEEEEEAQPAADVLLTDHSLRAARASSWWTSARTTRFLKGSEHISRRSSDDRCDARGRRRGVGKLIGLNRRWRFYRYDAGGTYRPHVDGAWPGSSVTGSRDRPRYEYDAFGDRLSRLTMLVYLNDDFEGGETAFFSAGDDSIDVTAGPAAAGRGALLPARRDDGVADPRRVLGHGAAQVRGPDGRCSLTYPRGCSGAARSGRSREEGGGGGGGRKMDCVIFLSRRWRSPGRL